MGPFVGVQLLLKTRQHTLLVRDTMPSPTVLLPVLSAITFVSSTLAQALGNQAGNLTYDSWPHVYPGMPDGDYCPEWQDYFRVTEYLPNVTWPLSRNWAGNIPVQRAGHPNDTLFFWASESSDGSFTADNGEPWSIWLNGGPGASSLLGLLFENGPIRVQSNSVVANQYSWTTIADHIWIDQPVYVLYSGSYQLKIMLTDRQMGFLDNFIKVFPNLATRPLYIIGESYAGTFIVSAIPSCMQVYHDICLQPYITKAYFQMDRPPVNLAGIAIGNGAFTNIQGFAESTVISVLETYPQVIGYDTEVFEYFKRQSELCGYNLTLRYPQPEPFPTLNAPIYSHAFNGSVSKYLERLERRQFTQETKDRSYARTQREEHVTGNVMCPVAQMIPSTLGTECDIYDMMVDYAVNYSDPWILSKLFDNYNIPDALNPEETLDGAVFLNDAQTRAAIHAPTSKDWAKFTLTMPFAPTNGTSKKLPMAFLTELATNATARNVTIVIYSGNDDSLNPHFGSQGTLSPFLADYDSHEYAVVIQNTTFGGIQGFTREPDTPWYNDDGEFAGIVHQERGWKYVLVANAGHVLPYTNPVSVRELFLSALSAPDNAVQALTLAREFIFGNNDTGKVTNTDMTDVVGHAESPLEDEILRGQPGIRYGHATNTSTYFYPSATVEAWNKYFATPTPTHKN
ncbi:Alpha/Beta hydrolase protein [Chiua virens]|nr:Alpha/Beta hydrolase protein [Chiua virens]